MWQLSSARSLAKHFLAEHDRVCSVLEAACNPKQGLRDLPLNAGAREAPPSARQCRAGPGAGPGAAGAGACGAAAQGLCPGGAATLWLFRSREAAPAACIGRQGHW